MTRKRARYDDKFRASAVVMLEAAGYPDKPGALMEVSRHLKVPHNTLRAWYHGEHNPPPSELRQEKKRELTEELRDIAYKLAGAIPDKIAEATLQQTATSLGIVIDKMQLLNGQPTWRVEILNLLKDGVITPQDIIDEFSDAPELAQELFESAGIRFAGIGQVEAKSGENTNSE